MRAVRAHCRAELQYCNSCHSVVTPKFSDMCPWAPGGLAALVRGHREILALVFVSLAGACTAGKGAAQQGRGGVTGGQAGPQAGGAGGVQGAGGPLARP